MTDIVRVAPGLSDEQIQIIKDTIAREASDEELRTFIQVCNRLALDPFAKQIYLIRRWDSKLRRMIATPQVSIEGFRVVAERTRQYRGQTKPEWCGPDGVWRDVWLNREPPAAARVGVYREGNKRPVYRPALYRSFVQTFEDKQSGKRLPAGLWATMPEVMLLKCAEAQALRATFPNELGGVYTDAEMDQAWNPPAAEPGEHRELPRERPQKAPEPIQARVVPIRPGSGATEPSGATTGESGAVVELFGRKLRERSNADQLAEWLKEVTKEGYAKPMKRVLWGMCKHRCHELGVDPNVVAQKSKVENAQQKQEANHG